MERPPPRRSTSTYCYTNKPVLHPLVEPGQYATDQITRFTANNDITRSMGRTGVCWDNAMAESFATLKTEFYYRRVWPTKPAASRAVGAWIEERYNRRRRHSAIGQISPVAFETQHTNQTAADHKAA
jgi:putative transposase